MLLIWIDMKRSSFCFLLLFALCISAIAANAQVYPIQSQVNLLPPYSGNLSDYTFPGSQRITVTLNCNDITISNYRIKLRFTIEGLGITVRSKPNVSFEPFIVDGGSPLLLYGDDLAQYLDPRNLDFVGLSRTEYQRTGKLPEGVYRFYVEVLDYNRSTVVSNKGFATAWVILNDPPILNLPANNSKTRVVDPTNIPFAWTPRHSSSPNSAFTSEYVFRLIEIWPSNRNPNDAFLSQTPLYELETSRTQIVYGPGEPLLIPGRKYAWQVQAKDAEGRDLFKNNGKSEVFVFQFGDAIEMPQNVRKETSNATTISIRWETSPTGEIPERFRIRYRPAGGTRWYEDVTTNYTHTLVQLQNNTSYDIQVRSENGNQVSDYTFSQRYSTTLPIVDESYQCGNPFNLVPPVMTTPLQNLNVGDVFKCSDFDHVLVREVTKLPEAGGFSGIGFARVNGFNRANLAVTFSGTFNNEFQMVTGKMVFISDPKNKMSQLIEEMKKIGEKPPVLDSAVANPDSNLIIITGVIDSVYFNSNGQIVVLDEAGSTQTFEQKKNGQGEKQEMIVKDSAGNTWTVDKDGNITAAESAVAGVFSSRDSLKFTVNFRENSSDQYGFDKDSNFPTPDKVQINAADYIVAWKSVEQGKQDFVDAFTLTENKFPKKVGFKMEAQLLSRQPGTEPTSTKLILPGGVHGDRQELIAYAKLKELGATTESEVVLGKLKVATYEYISRKVIIVPVKGTPVSEKTELQARLNKIYGQAVAGWQVTIEDNFEIEGNFLTKLDEEESGNLASYNKRMREFNRQYRSSNPAFDRTAFYMFLISGKDYRFDAFMPFKRGIGYVFVDKLRPPKDVINTIAHELGHGAFNLRHTFDEYSSVSRNTTDNLMDYNGGEALKKYQWDYVHNPESMIGWLQDDEESALYDCPMWFSGECEDVGRILELMRRMSSENREVVTRQPKDLSRKELVAKEIELDGEKFDKIVIHNLVEGEQIQYDPDDYEEYSQVYLTSEGKSDHQRGFVYRKKVDGSQSNGIFPAAQGPIIVKILLYHGESEFSNKLQKLKHYLFGNAGKGPIVTASNEKRFVIFKRDANIRNKFAPYGLISPAVYLEKGREVEIVRHLTEDENPRVLIKYKGEAEQYCTWTGNIKEIVAVDDSQLYKLKSASSPFVLPYSETTNSEVNTSSVLSVTHECGPYKCIAIKDGNDLEELGWVDGGSLKRYIDVSNLGNDEFAQKFREATSQAVTNITKDWKTMEAACNLCVRAALRNLTGDDVLYPTIGSSLTIRDKGEQIHGKVQSGEGSAQGIVDDLMAGRLSESFDEIEKSGSETYSQFWQRLQQLVDSDKAVIVGAFDPGHVFMIVPGGLYEVVDNTDRENSGENTSSTDVSLGDKWGGSFARRGHDYVLRIMDCGNGVKFSNGPMYGAMDAKAVSGERTDRTIKYFRYKSN
jgi:hypothetical protein